MSNTLLRSKTAAACFAVSASLGSAMFLASSATAQTMNQGTGQAAPSTSTQAMPQATMPSGGGEIPQEQLTKLDMNKDGVVAREEYNEAMSAAFKNLDKNSDNSLTAEEVGTILTPEQFAAVDGNKDGKISHDEMITQVTSDFDAADTNKDGQLK